MLKKCLWLIVMLVTLCVFTVACSNDNKDDNGNGEGESSSSEGIIELEFMGWEASPLETESVKKGLEKFMSENPNIKVTYTPVPNEQYHSKLLTMLAGSSAPDVFFLGAEEYRDFQSRDVLMDLTDTLAEDPDLSLDDFIDSSKQIMEIDGSVFGISSTTVSPVLYYNKDLFDEANIPYPPSNPNEAWTWEEFRDVANQLTIDEGDTQFGVYGLENLYNNIPLVLGNGGDVWAEDGSLALNSDATSEVWEKVKQLRYEDGASPAAQTLENIGMNASQMLQTGRVGMIIEGSWALQELATMGFPVGVAALPKIGEKAMTHGQAHLHSVWSETEHPEAAWKLVKFLSSEEYQLDLIREGLWMPNRIDMYSEEGIKEWHDESIHPEGFLELAPFFKDAQPYPFALGTKIAVRDAIIEEMEQYFNDDKSLEDALDNIDTRSSEALSK
ncbi:ABC transporter substrate-binding protein [Gracilibacillus sp. D59]|uniref:ABC transporter substrate-binding protein n=1 Tax=Gracilibacillus sp. D59 TaxID=3457434 RepID=UPI003FCD993E